MRYTESFNRVCEAGWDAERINGVELHHATYYAEREETGLPAQLVCSARVKATEALVSTKALRAKGKSVRCPHSKNQAIRYDARSAMIDLRRGKVSLASLQGRQHLTFLVPRHHLDRIDWKVCSTDLIVDRKGRFWIHVVVETATPNVKPTGDVVGVDLGVRRPAVTSSAMFLGERRWREVDQRTFRLRRALQAKGTRSARRHLKKLSRRQTRFRLDCDHVLSKQLVASVSQGCTIALEDLTDIRLRIKARKKQRRRLHSWSFARLQFFLGYKALAAGVFVAYVDPRYTSQKCSQCGHTSKANRKNQSRFQCKSCGFALNADLNAARNIRANHLASQAMGQRSGPSVNRPIVAIQTLGNRDQVDTSS